MNGCTPNARGRYAFTALYASLCLIASDRTVASGDPSPLFLLAPVIVVAATGQVGAREAFLRAGLSVIVQAASGLVVNVVHARGIPDYQNLGSFTYALTVLFALNLVVIVATSFAVRRIWPSSDHWTR